MFKKKRKIEESVLISESKEEIKEKPSLTSAIEIKNLEVGKKYYKIRFDSTRVDVDMVLILAKGTELPCQCYGFLLDTHPCNFIKYASLVKEEEKNASLESFLWKNNYDKSSCVLDLYNIFSDYKPEEDTYFFDLETPVKEACENYWQQKINIILQEKRKEDEKRLKEIEKDLNEQFKEAFNL